MTKSPTKRKHQDLRHQPAVVAIKSVWTTKYKKKVNNIVCDNALIQIDGHAIILDGDCFGTGRALLAMGVSANKISIVECDRKSYDNKVKNNLGFNIIFGRMEDKTQELIDYVGDSFVALLYFDGMNGTAAINATLKIVDSLRGAGKFVEGSQISVTTSAREAKQTNAGMLKRLVDELTSREILCKLSDVWAYGSPAAKKKSGRNQPMCFTRFLCTTDNIVAVRHNEVASCVIMPLGKMHRLRRERLLKKYPAAEPHTKFQKIVYKGFLNDSDWGPL